MVLRALFSLLLCQALGELVSRGCRVPVPGPVLGMLLLAALYAVRRRDPGPGMQTAADGLLRSLGLLFVPAGAGVVASLPLLRAAWLPLLAGLLVSTVLTLLTTALCMHVLSRRAHGGGV